MNEPRTLHCYEYVNRSYDEVRALLLERPSELFQSATSSAAERAQSIVTTLRVGAAGLVVGIDVRIDVGGPEQVWAPAGASEATRVPLRWRAAQGSALFPSMQADLTVWPLSPTETQLELAGSYRPPLGALGDALDAAVGHRIAEASVKRLLDDLVDRIRRTPVGS